MSMPRWLLGFLIIVWHFIILSYEFCNQRETVPAKQQCLLKADSPLLICDCISIVHFFHVYFNTADQGHSNGGTRSAWIPFMYRVQIFHLIGKAFFSWIWSIRRKISKFKSNGRNMGSRSMDLVKFTISGIVLFSFFQWFFAYPCLYGFKLYPHLLSLSHLPYWYGRCSPVVVSMYRT